MQKLVLLVFENILYNFQHRFLPKVNKTVKNFESVLIGYHVREKAEKWTCQKGLQDNLSGLKVDVKDSLSFLKPALDIFYKSVKFGHAVYVDKAPFTLL